MHTVNNQIYGAGLGLRREFLPEIITNPPNSVGFYEVAPENWMTIGGKLGHQFRAMTERFDFVCHGLSLSIGSLDPLDEKFVYALKNFIRDHGIKFYSEHLSYCSHAGHLYDLLPIPFTEDAIIHVVKRIKRVQDILEQKIALENVSYYAAPGQEMNEIDFFNAVITEANCKVLIDINNIYVNSINHGYNAETFLQSMPKDRIVYAHVAGHYVEADDLLIDTHGADVIDSVWQLLAKTFELYGVLPTLLERDFNIPPLKTLLKEVDAVGSMQNIWHSKQKQKIAQCR